MARPEVRLDGEPPIEGDLTLDRRNLWPARCAEAERTICGSGASAGPCVPWHLPTEIEVDVCPGQRVRVPMYSDQAPAAKLAWTPPGAMRVVVVEPAGRVEQSPGHAMATSTARRQLTVVVENRSHATTRVSVAMDLVVFE